MRLNLKPTMNLLRKGLKKLNLSLKKLLKIKKNKPRLPLISLMIGMISITGCSALTKEAVEEERKVEQFVVSALPVFPLPHPDVSKELKEVCPFDKCHKLYEWLSKLQILEQQLNIYEDIL